MSLYLDTSCFLKLLIPEPETQSVQSAIEEELRVVVSIITEIESLVQLHAFQLGGNYSKRRLSKLLDRLEDYREMDPFEFRTVDPSIFETARNQILEGAVHCRTMDRLHLAAMQDLRMSRLLTNDKDQAEAARNLGFQVMLPSPERN